MRRPPQKAHSELPNEVARSEAHDEVSRRVRDETHGRNAQWITHEVCSL